jgi:PAS domain S-box-containing protein
MMIKTVYKYLFSTLRGRLIVGVAVVHALMMTLFIVDLTVRQRAMLLDRQAEEAIALSHALATSAAGWIAAYDISGLQELVEVQKRYPELLFAILVDEKGRVLANTDRSKTGLYLYDLPEEAKQTVFARSPALVDVAAPAVIQGRVVGWARVGIGQKSAGEKLAEITRSGIVYALGAIVLGSVIAWLMGRKISRRLYAVQETINKVQAGDQLARSSITGDDEAAMMAKEFNLMLDAVAERDAELRTSEEQFRAVVENSPVVVFSIDRNGVFTLSEGKGLKKLGIAPGEVVGKSVFELYAHNSKIISNFNRSLKGESFTTVDDEAGFSFETRWTHIRDDAGKVNRIVGVSVDVTERKQAVEELKKHHDHLEEMVTERTAELEAFVYSVSHDLRAPLRHIDGFLELLQKKIATGIDEQCQHYMDTISDSARRMGNLIDDLLAFSRMGRQALSAQPLELRHLAQEVIHELELETNHRNIHWHIGDLPVVKGDMAMLRIVLVNLIANSVKFTRPRACAKIEIGCLPSQDSETAVFVRDNGVGFDMTYADKLFGVFQRLHRQEEFEGTGIGLANVRRIIERHGGRTWADGKVDQGATFYFSLPQNFQGA